MKTIRRKQITIREKESIVVKTTINHNGQLFCPFCNAPIQTEEAHAGDVGNEHKEKKELLSGNKENKNY